MTFRSKLISFSLTVFFLIAVVTIFLVYYSQKPVLTGHIAGEIEYLAFSLTDKLDRILFERQADIRFLATDPVLRSRTSSPRQIAERLRLQKEIYWYPSSIAFFDLGRVRIADTSDRESGRRHPGTGYWPAIAEGREVAVSLDESQRNGIVIEFAARVRDLQEMPRGVVASRIPFGRLAEVISQSLPDGPLHGEEGANDTAPAHLHHYRFDVVDRQGLLLYSNELPRDRLRTLYPDWPYIKSLLASGSHLGSHHFVDPRETIGEEIFAFATVNGYRDFPGLGWTAIVRVPAETALTPLVHLRQHLLLALALIALLCLATVTLYARRATEPLLRLTAASRKAREGEFDLEIDVDSRDEIGELAAAFNAMLVELKTSRDKLLTFNQELRRQVVDRTSALRDTQEELEVELAERKKAQEILGESEERYRRIVETAQEGIVTLDTEGSIVFANSMFGAMVQKDNDELGALPFIELVVPAHRPVVGQILESNAAAGDFQLPLRRGESDLWVLVSSSPLRDHHGQRRGTLLMLNDISERVRAEKDLKERMLLLALEARIGSDLTETDRLGTMLQTCSETLVSHLDVPLVRIWLTPETGTVLALHASAGLQTVEGSEAPGHPVDRPLVDAIAASKEPHLIAPLVDAPRLEKADWVRRNELTGFAGFPLLVGDRLTGVLAVFCREMLSEASLQALESVARIIALSIVRQQTAAELQESKERFRAVAETANDAFVMTDQGGRVLYWNPAAERIFGFSEEEMLGQSVERCIPPLSRKPHAEGMKRSVESGQGPPVGLRTERRGRRKDGTEFPLEISFNTWRQGDRTYFSAIIRDISERKEAEEALQESEERFRQIAENIQEVFWMTDPDHSEQIYISPAYEEIWGRSCQSWYEEPYSWVESIHPDDRESVLQASASKEISGEFDEEFRIVRPDGEVRWIHDRAYPIEDEAGQVYRIVGIAEDITDRKHLENRLQEMALRDELTGLYNRRGFMTLAEQELKIARRKSKKVALCFIDLDNMKRINDEHGHQAGDEALQQTARLLRETFRESDIIARMGGDEFAVAAVDTDKPGAETQIGRFGDNVAAANRERELPYNLSISVGTAIYDPDDPVSLEKLINRADRKMYEEKKRKRAKSRGAS